MIWSVNVGNPCSQGADCHGPVSIWFVLAVVVAVVVVAIATRNPR